MSERHTTQKGTSQRIQPAPATPATIGRVGGAPEVAYEWRKPGRRYPLAEAAIAAAEAEYGTPGRSRDWRPREETPQGQQVPYAPFRLTEGQTGSVKRHKESPLLDPERLQAHEAAEARVRARNERKRRQARLQAAPEAELPAPPPGPQEPAQAPSGGLAGFDDAPRCDSCGYTLKKCGGKCRQ